MKMNRASFPPESFSSLAEVESGHWWFESRNKLILWILRKYKNNFENLLEVGCGTGFVLTGIRRQHPQAKLVGAEFFEEGLKHARKRIPSAEFIQLDATEMSDEAKFDVIGAFDVIEHIEDDKKVLLNFYKALKDRGILLLTIPQHQWLWSNVDSQAGHFRRYSWIDLKEKIETAGFKIKHTTSFVSLLVPVMWLTRQRAQKDDYNPMSEFQIPWFLNLALKQVMKLETLFIKLGLRFRIGGSRIVVAEK